MSKKKPEALTQEQLVDMIACGDYDECLYKLQCQEKFLPYDGCQHNLLLILNDPETVCDIAQEGSEYYEEGSHTVVMYARCFPAVILFRTKTYPRAM